jgi:hypothetical protein
MGEFDFEDRPVSVRKTAKSGLGPLTLAGGILGIAVLAVGTMWFLSSKPAKLTLDAVEDQVVNEEAAVQLTLKATVEGLKQGEYSYGMISGPPGARVEAKTGVFRWIPDEEQGPGEFQVTVAVQSKGSNPIQDKKSFKITVSEVNQAPTITAIPNQKAVAGESIKLTVQAKDADLPAQTLSYRLKKGPPGATIDATTGVFTWAAPESPKGDQSVEISVADATTGGAEAITSFTIQVEAPTSDVPRLIAALQGAGLTIEKSIGETPAGFTGESSTFAIGDEYLTVLEYESDELARKDAAQVTDEGQVLFGKPAAWKTRTNLYRRGRLIAIYDGTSARTAKLLAASFGEPFLVADASKMTPVPEKPVELTIGEKLVNSLVKLHEQQDLTGKTDYPGLRKLFAEFFEQQNELVLNQLATGDGAEFKKWLDEHVDFKEEFYTAVAPEDDLAAAWKILQTLHRKYPTRLNDYGQLAIATALTWDTPGNVDHYDDHQRRTHSNMPAGLLEGVENFEYFVDAAGVMQGRTQFLPWEFLVYLVNHKTPRAEREWAAANYVPKRTMYGKCYAEVPYDTEMLRTHSKTCKLEGKDYSLPNIRQFGGVCAMQADFASRVGKSIGVPAEYVGGESNGGELHAWVMWVEIKQVSKTGISFTLESHGRYFGDKYYVGTLRDPQTGRGITDRELELRLQAVGLSPVAFHHARLVMQAYPQLRDKLELKPVQEIALLNDVIELCPGNEAAWRHVAQLARDGRITSDSNRQMTAMFDKLFRTFSAFPDFTWKVFDDLVQYQKNPKQRNKYYERLVQMYEAGGRPDLACEARLRLCDYLLEEGHTKEVIDGLAFTIKKFPDEGRYVPKLLDKLEQVCAAVKGMDQQLLRFYQEFIPLVPQKRGDEPSPYCMRMLERAIEKFTSAGQAQQAQGYAAQLSQLKAAGAK